MVSNQNHFTIFHILVLTLVLDHSQVSTILKETAIHKLMYPNWVPQNTRLACAPCTNKTNPFHSCHGVQVPSKLRLQAPTLETQSQYGA